MKVNSPLNGFGQGTLVLMADGKEKPIEQILPGDKVMSFDQFDAFAPLEARKVLDIASRIDRGALEINVIDSDIKLTVAPGQLFINTKHDWHNATNINEIIDRNGNVCKFDVKQIKTGKHAIYDIIVEDNHSLVANGVRVHNMVKKARREVLYGATPGAAANHYSSDYDSESNTYTHGKATKKKSKTSKIKSIKKSNTLAYAKPDNLAVAGKLLTSMSELTDLTIDIVDAATPSQLNTLKATVKSSITSIINYDQAYLTSILNASTSTYDKAELYQWGLDILQAASDAYKPFYETVVTASGKLTALNQLSLINLNLIRSQAKIGIYTTPDTKGDLDVTVNGRKTPKKKLSALPKSQPAQKQATGKYQIRSCFTFDTMVSLASGDQVMIGTIEAGDLVLGRNNTINKVVGVEVVTLGTRSLYGFNGMAPFVSEEHPLMTSKGWGAFKVNSLKKYEPEVYDEVSKESKLVRIKQGSTLVTENGEVKITDLEKMEADPSLKIYNLLLDNDHTYFANGILVHNKNNDPGGPSNGSKNNGSGSGSSSRSTGGFGGGLGKAAAGAAMGAAQGALSGGGAQGAAMGALGGAAGSLGKP